MSSSSCLSAHAFVVHTGFYYPCVSAPCVFSENAALLLGCIWSRIKMEKSTLSVSCVLSPTCACAGASSSTGMEMVWLLARVELVSAEARSQLMWNLLALSLSSQGAGVPPQRELTALLAVLLTGSDRPGANEQIAVIIISLALQELGFFSEQWGTWVLQFMRVCCSAGCGWVGALVSWGWVNAQVMWGQEENKNLGGEGMTGVWFYRALFYFCLIREGSGDFTM